MHSVVGGQRGSFFPKADAAVLQTKHKPPSPTSRPSVVAPIFDVEHANQALSPYSIEVARSVYPTKDDIFAPAVIPRRPTDLQRCGADRYLFPVLTPNERLRLTMLFYYTRGALEDTELQSRLSEKVDLARETAGWEFVIAGLLDHNTYTRMATVGLPLAVLPRRESTCAHTVNQPPGMVFSLLNMTEDWRFRGSPHVEEGGLRAYAGVPLRFETEFGDHVAFGSLCVASNSLQASLDESQQRALARLADWIVSDIIHSARARRQRERRRMLERLAEAEKRCGEGVCMEEYISEMLQAEYPTTIVGIFTTTDGEIVLEGGTVFRLVDLEHGLWEDTECFDYMIEEQNHGDMIAPRVVRVISTQCASQRLPTFILVGSKNFRDIFDDIDSWFVMMCAGILCRYWQNHALKEALDVKETFLRGITHQLRTPMHGILGSIELLTEELRSRNVLPETASACLSATLDAERSDPYVYIQTIRTSVKELISVVNSLIKLNQWTGVAQTDRTTAFHKVGSIETALLEDSLPALSEDISSRPSLVISHQFPPYLDMLSIDLRLFLDCIEPLIVNAIQNTTGGVVAVTLSFMTDCSRFVVDVEDNGRGITPHDYERVFAACEKVDSHTAKSGLGLTLACMSAKLMNGSISLVSSKIGKGSHFRATFDGITCASSFPPQQLIKQRLAQLPPTFQEVSPPSTTPSLCRFFNTFLTHHGYAASDCRDGSLMLLDYSQDSSQLYHHLRQLSMDRVAICLLPESMSRFIDSENSRVRRNNNVVYVKAPLLSRSFEEALELADAVISELASSSGNIKGAGGGEDLDVTEPAAYHPVVDGGSELEEQTPTFPPKFRTEIAQSFEKLDLGSPLPISLFNTQIHAAKPMALLVDDNVINLRLLEMYCNRRSIPYRVAKDGEEAMLICDGISATYRIRELERERGLVRSIVFMVTGQDSPSDRASADRAGADKYLVKPIAPKALDRWVKQWFPGWVVG